MSREITNPFRWVAVLALSAACAGGEAPVQVESNDASTHPITDVSHTPVKRQSIGNCWLYATASWAESLHRDLTGETLDLSESYGTYWHWFEQIANEGTGEIQTGGSWGVAVELISRYGLMLEGDFIPGEANSEMSFAQSRALGMINASLAAGPLADWSARQDRALVRSELDKAFGLEPDVVAQMDAVFGKAVTRTLDRSTISLAGRPIFRSRSLAVSHVDAFSGDKQEITLADAIGTASSTWNPDVRNGPFAWSEAGYPGSVSRRRNLQIRVQRAMHLSQPVVMSWLVDFNALDASGAFSAPPLTIGRQGGHMVVAEDYEIDNVPGFGTLPVGVDETRPDALQAALSPEADLQFIRVKNSWGNSRPDRPFVIPGYHDLFMEYLDGPIGRCVRRADEPAGVDPENRPCLQSSPTTPLWSFVLPPGF
jgi:hypothetical protein